MVLTAKLINALNNCESLLNFQSQVHCEHFEGSDALSDTSEISGSTDAQECTGVLRDTQCAVFS